MTVVSAANNYNKTLVDDAASALLRGPSAQTDAASATAPAGDANQADSNRGPAVQVTLSALTDAATRLQALNAQPDDTATALADQLQKSNDTLNTLDQARKSTASDRKAEAEQKLEQARKKLQLLQILGGDPKNVAAQAKDIGKDLKTAASEYTTALKDQAAGTAAAGDATTSAASADATTAASAATAPGATPADKPADAAPASGTASPADASAATPANPDTARQQAAYQSPADAAAAKAAAYKLGQHDRDVLASFKDAANQLKQVLQDASHRTKARNAADPGVAGTAQTRDELDKAVNDLAETIEIKQSGGDISGTGGPGGLPAPVDILA